MGALSKFGFRELCFYTEALGRFSLIFQFPIYVLMRLKGEQTFILRGLRIAGAFPLLLHEDPMTCALVFGLGVKFYSLFGDGSTLISTNFPSHQIEDVQSKFYKYIYPGDVESAWSLHRGKIVEFQSKQMQPVRVFRFEDYSECSRREEDQGLRGQPVGFD